MPVARAAGTPTIMIGASAPGLAGGADSIFSGYASDNFQGKFAAEYIYNVMGKKKVAVFYVKNDWGQGLDGVFVKRFKELGGEVVFDEGAAQDSKDVKN
jgi:branched-chain amino acid transport system substrate-binding protein